MVSFKPAMQLAVAFIFSGRFHDCIAMKTHAFELIRFSWLVWSNTEEKRHTCWSRCISWNIRLFRVTINRSNMFLRCINSMPLIVSNNCGYCSMGAHTQVLFLLGPHCPFLEVDCHNDTEKTYHPCMLCFCAFGQVVILKTWGWPNMHLYQGVMFRPS